MKTAKELLQAYIDGSAQQAAALFASNGALELPYLADLGVEPRYEGPENIGAFLTFLHEKMYPNFKFVDVKIYIDTPDQAFGEYTIHQKSGISGKNVHQRFFGHCTVAEVIRKTSFDPPEESPKVEKQLCLLAPRPFQSGFPSMRAKKHLVLILCIASSFLTACRKQETAPAELSILIQNVTVIDPSTSSVTPATSVLVTGGKIQTVAPAGQLSNIRARVVDGTGKYLIPGLWDMHVHTNMGDWIPGATEVTLPLFIANGVTGIRTMGDELPSILQWRDAIAQGKLLGPRMVSSGPMLDGPKPNFPASVQIATPADAVHAVDSLKTQGVDFIKIQSLIPRNAYFAAAAEARKQGIVFAGHVPDAVRASEAAQAGQKSIEHYTGVFEGCSTIENKLITGPRGPRKSVETFNQARADKLIALFVKDQTWQVPTLVWERGQWLIDKTDLQHEPLDKYVPLYWKGKTYPRFVTSILATLDTDPISFRERYVEMEMEMTAAMHRAGVPFLAGTDTAAGVYVVPGFSLHEEMELFQQAGFTPMEALQTATSNPARFLGTEATMGSVAPGKIADLVLLNADPTVDIHNARKIESVVLAGKYFSRDDLDNLLLQVQQAALKIR